MTGRSCVICLLVILFVAQRAVLAQPAVKDGAKLPEIKEPVIVGAPEADAIAAALQVFPPDNDWNTDISRWPVHPNSAALVASIGNEKPLRYNTDMSFVFVPPGQKKIDVEIVEYPDESDKGPYPVPENTPIEGWPAWYTRDAELKQTLEEVQRDKLNQGGDRHAIVVDPHAGKLYEFYQMKRTARRERGFQRSGFIGQGKAAGFSPGWALAVAVQVRGDDAKARRQAHCESAILPPAAREGVDAQDGAGHRCTHQRFSSTCAMRRAARAAPSVSTSL